MKKSIFIAVLGVTATIASSYGQGYINFSSYAANGTGATTSMFTDSSLIGSPFQAELLYSLTPVSDPVNNTLASSIISDPNAGLTAIPSSLAAFDNTGAATGALGLGYYDGTTLNNGVAVIIPGYLSGAVTFEVIAFNGADWADSSFRGGRQSLFSLRLITSAGQPANVFSALPNSFVAPVPEPATLALAGLSGFASLVAFRRKQA